MKKHTAPILDIMSRKSSGRLDTPLHMSANILNPYYLYNSLEVQKDDDANDPVVDLAQEWIVEGDVDEDVGEPGLPWQTVGADMGANEVLELGQVLDYESLWRRVRVRE
ncbi:hypothetical protein Tco_0915266 [Tanacetum coccineum]